MVEFQKLHFMIALGALQRVITEGKDGKFTPGIEIQQNPLLGFRDCFVKGLVYLTMPCIKSVIACHFEMLFRNVLD